MSDSILHFTVTALVFHQGHVLLVEHRKSGFFLGPSGHIEANEDPVSALHRELAEEVGITVDVITDRQFTHPAVSVIPSPFASIIVNIPHDPIAGPHQHVDFIYVCRPHNTNITMQAEEIDSARWIPLAEVATLHTPPEYPDLIAAAAKYVDEVTGDYNVA